MPITQDHAMLEYTELMSRGRDGERTAQVCWIAGALTAAVMLSWAISAKSPGLMIPVVFAIAIGFYGMLRGRQQVRWIGSYLEEFYEGPNGPQWFTRVHRLQNLPGYHPVGDWLTTLLANMGVVLTVMLAWMYSGTSPRGDLLAGIAAACGVVFAVHSVYETVSIGMTDSRAMWRQVGGELHETTRPRQAASY